MTICNTFMYPCVFITVQCTFVVYFNDYVMCLFIDDLIMIASCSYDWVIITDLMIKIT